MSFGKIFAQLDHAASLEPRLEPQTLMACTAATLAQAPAPEREACADVDTMAMRKNFCSSSPEAQGDKVSAVSGTEKQNRAFWGRVGRGDSCCGRPPTDLFRLFGSAAKSGPEPGGACCGL